MFTIHRYLGGDYAKLDSGCLPGSLAEAAAVWPRRRQTSFVDIEVVAVVPMQILCALR